MVGATPRKKAVRTPRQRIEWKWQPSETDSRELARLAKLNTPEADARITELLKRQLEKKAGVGKPAP
ncbi:MAG TPA: hypothetical protein VJA40_03255 [archaeon]|nr:hypothetical protein [archaeon]